MATLVNNNTRVFYAMKALAVGPIGSTSIEDSSYSLNSDEKKARITHGVQSANITTDFSLEQAFEFGQLTIYENIEEVPDVEVTVEKVLDGYSLLYHLGTPEATTAKLTGRADSRADVRMVVVQSTDDVVASGKVGVAELYCSGMYLSSVNYNLVTDGSFTESVTFVGNNKKWITTDNDAQSLLLGTANSLGGTGSGVNNTLASIFGDDTPSAGAVLRRHHFTTNDRTYSSGTFITLLPADIQGIPSVTASGNSGAVDTNNVHIQSMTVSADLGRESINHLGTKDPYFRYVDFPTEITSEFEVIALGGDEVTAVGDQVANQLTNRKIQVVLSDSTVIQLGNKNKLSNVSYGGGDAGGGNDTITYSYSTFNDFVVLHSGDPLRGSGGLSEAAYWTDHFPV